MRVSSVIANNYDGAWDRANRLRTLSMSFKDKKRPLIFKCPEGNKKVELYLENALGCRYTK